MGLIDVLNGMQNGPRGEPVPGKGGMSKITMALLGLLAWKAYKGMSQDQVGGPARSPTLEKGEPQDDQAGGLAGVLRTIFGGSAVPAPVLRRGVDNTVRDLESNGHGDVARSWVGRGPNKRITPENLQAALGEEAIRDLIGQTGMDRRELLEVLSEHLPRVIDHLTPDGRIPTNAEVKRLA
jgi:uncharacterized protein YidB (DUF937 family)